MSVVEGRVVDAAGKPIAGAQVTIGAHRMGKTFSERVGKTLYELLAQTTAGRDESFRLSMPRTHNDYGCLFITAAALAPGYGVDAQTIQTDVPHQEIELVLEVEHPISAKLLDPRGEPAVGVEVKLQAVNNWGSMETLPKFLSWDYVGSQLWPKPVKTDEQGLFVFHGIGRGFAQCELDLEIDDPRFAPQFLKLELGGEQTPEARLSPLKTIEGVALHQDTGTPIAGAKISVVARAEDEPWPDFGGIAAKADVQGRFQVRPARGKFLQDFCLSAARRTISGLRATNFQRSGKGKFRGENRGPARRAGSRQSDRGRHGQARGRGRCRI